MITFFPSQPDLNALQAVSVIGIGGAGTHILNELLPIAPAKLSLISVNTASRTDGESLAHTKIRIGSEITRGLNCGGDPTLGRQAAEASLPLLSSHIQDQEMIFLTAGLGGGSGSGIAPSLARAIRESGAFLVTFVTLPFSFEGPRRVEQAKSALNELSLYSNMILVFENDRMSDLVSADEGIQDAFIASNKLVAESIASVARMCLKPGLISMGLPDIADVLGDHMGKCLFGFGSASGYDRAGIALQKALSCPLIKDPEDLLSSEEILIHITGGSDLTLQEVEKVVNQLTDKLSPDAGIHIGVTIDEVHSGLSLVIMSGDIKPPLGSQAKKIALPFQSVSPDSITTPIIPPSPKEEEDGEEALPAHEQQPGDTEEKELPLPVPPPLDEEANESFVPIEESHQPVNITISESEFTFSPITEEQSEMNFTHPSKGKFTSIQNDLTDGIDLDLPPSMRNKGL